MRCNDARLKQLIASDDSSADFVDTVRHVESCTRCQKRLDDLSSDGDLLNEVRESLSDVDETYASAGLVGSSIIVAIEGGLDEPGVECEPVSLDFLTPPSHPEMLGRIGRYEVERIIGSGGMGIVLKGFDTDLHRVVAIKVLKPHLAHNGAARHRFAREAQSAAAVVHEHVIPIHDVQSDGAMPFLVMQYVPGQSLQARVDERGPLEPREVLRIARQIAAGLAAAHAQGLVHRDVKPANILMEESVERVLISDFGLARTVDDATLTRTGIVAGTPHYMSPEQAGGRAIDARSDLFSLGSVLYFMCAGRPPFRAEHAMAILNRICHEPHRPVDEVNGDVPPELAETIDRLLSKDPAARFRSAQVLERHLESILLGLQAGRRSYRLGISRNWLRLRSRVARVARHLAVIATCVLAGIGFSRWYWPDTQSIVPIGGSETQDADRGHDRSTDRNSDEGMPTVAVPNDFPKIESLRGDQPIEIPLDRSTAQFDQELNAVNALVRDLEVRWDRTEQIFELSERHRGAWHDELETIRSQLQLMDQRSESLNVRTKTE